jgi:ATP-dependent helicase IRC3
MKLWHFQKEAKKEFFDSYERGEEGGLLYLATGTGKTVIASNIAMNFPGPITFLVHRKELATQAMSKMMAVWRGVDIGLIRGDVNQFGRRVTVASIPTLQNKSRMESFLVNGGDKNGLVIVDESHHSPAKSWTRVINSIPGYKLGLTATPQRQDGAGLDSIFKKILYKYTIADGIEDEYLTDISGLVFDIDLNLDGVKMNSNGDFNTSQLGDLMKQKEMIDFICEKWIEHGIDRKTVFFCVDIEHCKLVAAELCRRGIDAEHIAGDMDDLVRDSTLRRFHKGQLKCLTSCMILTEGWDEPSVDCIVLCRPTSSESLYIQMVGRGVRLFPGKKNLLVLDFVGNSDKHRIMQLGILTGEGRVDAGSKKKTANKDGHSGSMEPKVIPSIKDVLAKEKRIETRRKHVNDSARFDWIDANGVLAMNMGSQNGYIVIKEMDDQYMVQHQYRTSWEDVTTNLLDSPTTIDMCISMAEEAAGKIIENQKTMRLLSKEKQSWHSKPASQKQIEILRKFRVNHIPENMKDASLMIDQVFFEGFQNRRKHWKQSKSAVKQVNEIRQAFYNKTLSLPLTLKRIDSMSAGEAYFVSVNHIVYSRGYSSAR